MAQRAQASAECRLQLSVSCGDDYRVSCMERDGASPLACSSFGLVPLGIASWSKCDTERVARTQCSHGCFVMSSCEKLCECRAIARVASCSRVLNRGDLQIVIEKC